MLENKNVVIGGEKFFSLKDLFSMPKNNLFHTYETIHKNYNINYTFGGYSSLLAILDNLNSLRKNNKVLLPAYTCSSVIEAFRIKKVSYVLYRSTKNLVPDLEDIKSKCNNENFSAILFIDYLGKNQFSHIESILNLLEKKKIVIIQDSVHSLLVDKNQIYGDYAFNSLRKITPFEGSLLLSKKKLNIKFDTGSNLKFIWNKRIAQFIRNLHLSYGLFKPELFLKFFQKAESYYKNVEIYKLTGLQRFLIRRIDLKKIIDAKIYYSKLLNSFSPSTLEWFKDLNFTPLGFFLIIPNRDNVRKKLMKNGIFCPIHWKLPESINQDNFPTSHIISQQALTIPLYDIDNKKFTYLLKNLQKIL